MRNPLTLEDFIQMTQRIIVRESFDEYLPTLILPARAWIGVLEGVPSHVDVEIAAREWASVKLGESNEDYFLAFKANTTHFKAVARINGTMEERIAPAVAPKNGAACP